VLVVVILLAAAMACGGTEKEAAKPTQREGAVSPGDFIAYEGPQTPKDTEWLLRYLDGSYASEGSDVKLYHDK